VGKLAMCIVPSGVPTAATVLSNLSDDNAAIVFNGAAPGRSAGDRAVVSL
jgi:hypothetical protein